MLQKYFIYIIHILYYTIFIQRYKDTNKDKLIKINI